MFVAAPADDPRRVVVLSMALEIAGRPNLELALDTPGAFSLLAVFVRTDDLTEKLAKAKATPLVLKEGTEYRLTVTFRVQHEIVTGLKYLQIVKRKGVKGARAEHSSYFIIC